MDSPQYLIGMKEILQNTSFKPYYKWIVLNTEINEFLFGETYCFKPYYKWIVLNT